MGCRILHFSLLFLLVTAPASLAEDQTGEAKASSQNAMKKVEDGDPILNQNMMQHMMMAQMYEAQMNFPMAAQERMKAQMLQQQIETNNNSRDRNQDRRDNAIFTSDKAQSQTVGPIQGGFVASGAPNALGSFFSTPPEPKPSAQEQISSEFLTFDEATPKTAVPETTVNVETAVGTEKSTASTSTQITADAVSPERQAELVADLEGVESQLFNATELAEADIVSPVRDISAPPILVVEKRDKTKEKADDEFWKDPKKSKVKKQTGKRAIASKKKATKSPNRLQTGTAHHSSPPDRKPH